MSIFLRRAFGFTALAIAACAVGGASWAEQEAEEPGTQRAFTAPQLWPSRFYLGDDVFTVYPPQLERWERDRLDGRAAVAVQAAGAEAPVFGVVSLSARTDVDPASGMVTVRDIDAGSGSFPTAADHADAYLRAVRRHLATLTWRVALARLQADLAIDQAAERGRSQPLRNDPPRIVYVQSPTILVPIDGEPVLREIAGSGLLRVVNTRALILQDQMTSRYFLYVAGYWLEATALEGPWTEAQVRPMALDEARQKALAEGSVDLLEDDESVSPRAPRVIVSTGPTELVQTDGPPQYAPIGRTDLLFVTNSPNRLFLDLRTQTHYVLLAGRWYRTSSLARGTWGYVPGADLPADFAMIPDDHPTGSIRAAVPGTAEAQESVIANSVPEIATVKRSAARLEIAYDGLPEFRPIEGTTLEAAANAPVPVIRVDWRTYYALDNGVWFFSDSAEGPWTAATSVPSVIYTIPRSHPLHYVTYVRVYDATAEDVYVGYTPGYVGSYVTTETTVVYGTGWYYRPWVGTVWYAPPVTWGFGFSFYYSWWDPWPRRAWWPAWRPVPCFRPAWGPWPHHHVGVKYPGAKVHGAVAFAGGERPKQGHGAMVTNGRSHDRTAFRGNTVSAGDIYRRWDPGSVSSHRAAVRPDGRPRVRSDVRPDVRPGVRATDRSAPLRPPVSSQRDERRPRLDHDQRLGGGQRPQLDAPHWVRPGDRDRITPRDRVAARPGAAPPSAIPPQGNIPARRPAGADKPRSPSGTDRTRPPAGADRTRSSGSWTGDPNAAGSRPRQFDGGRRFESQQRPQQDPRRSVRRDDVAPSAAQRPRPNIPPSVQQQPRREAVEAPSRRPDAKREFRAPPRQHDSQRDSARTSPPAVMRPTPGATRAPRNAPAAGSR
jgi:hypothetical protein